jgi:urease accessory protein
MRNRIGFTAALLALALAPGAALAHPALYHHTHTFLDGVTHPLTGLDHLLAMVSVGLWASQKGGRALYLWPLWFLTAMIAGGAAGMAGEALPLMEPMIAASLLVLGLAIAAAIDMPVAAGMALIAVFGLFHGNAHGLEAPADGSGLAYAAGFVLSTATLHALGVGLGLAAIRDRAGMLVRAGAVLVAVTGGVLFFT